MSVRLLSFDKCVHLCNANSYQDVMHMFLDVRLFGRKDIYCLDDQPRPAAGPRGEDRAPASSDVTEARAHVRVRVRHHSWKCDTLKHLSIYLTLHLP